MLPSPFHAPFAIPIFNIRRSVLIIFVASTLITFFPSTLVPLISFTFIILILLLSSDLLLFPPQPFMKTLSLVGFRIHLRAFIFSFSIAIWCYENPLARCPLLIRLLAPLYLTVRRRASGPPGTNDPSRVGGPPGSKGAPLSVWASRRRQQMKK